MNRRGGCDRSRVIGEHDAQHAIECVKVGITDPVPARRARTAAPPTAALACARPAPDAPEYQGQTYREALIKICKVDELAGLASEDDPLEKSQKSEDWLNEQVENPDAIYFGGIIENNAGQLLKDKVGAGMSNDDVLFIGPDGIFVDTLLTQAGEAAG